MSTRILSAAVGGLALSFGIHTALAAGNDEVIVTATRSDTGLDALAVPVIVIERREIESAHAADAADLLAGRAGIEVARYGGPGQLASLFLRGANSDHTTVLIDGVRINPGTVGGAPLQNVLPESLERVEVVKGARSALYGSDAIGGVINFITRSGAARGLTVSASDGSFGSESLGIDGGADLGAATELGGDLTWRRSDGIAPLAGFSDPRGYRTLSGDVGLRHRVSDSTEVGVRYWHANGNTQYQGYDPFQGYAIVPMDQDFWNDLVAADARWHAGAATLQLTASHLLDELQQKTLPDYARTRRDTLDLQYDLPLGTRQALTFGAVASREHTASLLSLNDPFNADPLFSVARRSQYAYAQDQLSLGRGHLLLAAGSVHDSVFGEHGSWNVEYALPLAAGWQLGAAAGSGFHAPTSTDLYGYGGNPALRPEQSHQYELGLRRDTRGADGRLARHVSLQAFDNSLSNLIVVSYAPPTYQPLAFNVNRARLRGIEFEVGLATEAWRLDASLTLQEPRDVSRDQWLLRRAREYAALRGSRTFGAWQFGAELLYAGARNDYGSISIVSMHGYTLAALSASTDLARQWRLSARVDNLGNTRYESSSGYNTPGRAATVAVSYRLR